MGGMRRIRCAVCGAKYWMEMGRDDRGDLVVDYCDSEGTSVLEDSEGRQICGCGHEIGMSAPRQPFYVRWDGVEYPEVW